MQSQRRLWRCPICAVAYRIPVSVEDVMACPHCTGEAEPPGVWIRDSDWAAESSRPGLAAEPQSVPRPFEWRPDIFQDEGLRPQTPTLSAPAPPAEPPAGPPPRPTSRRPAVIVASTIVAAAALAVLLGLRPYSWVEIFAGPPEVRRNPNETAPLVALVEFSTREPAVASVEIDDGERQWTYRPDGPPQTEHSVALLGLRPDREHEIRVRVEGPRGWFYELSDPLTLETPPLPDDFPPLKTVVSRPEKMEPGVTLLAVNRWWQNQRDTKYGYVILLDERGEVVWYFRAGRGTADMRLLRNGHLLCNDTNYRQMYEVDLLGNVVREWQTTSSRGVSPRSPPRGPVNEAAVPVEADTLHHEILELPSGNFLALSTELRRVDRFPTSETDPEASPAPADVVGDVIVEFQRDGTVVRRWKLLDLLDPRRIGYGSLSDFWKRRKDPRLFGADWSHANALCYDPRDDAMIVSLRHQDCLVKIDRASSRIEWILGDPAGWREPWTKYLLQPKGDLQWPYHQHGPELTPDGTILMYDNGNYRALPFDSSIPAPLNYSRAVEFRVDEDARTVEQIWEYRGPDGESFYCPFYCEADALPQTDNVLITDGGHIETADGIPADAIPSGRQWARLLEVTRAEPAETVFEVVLDSGADSPAGWSVYRSERLPDVEALSDLATAELNDE